jgi:hypothetical protein
MIKLKTLLEGLRRFKVYIKGESKPLILMGKNEREVKKLAHMMIRNSSVKIRKVVKEEKLTEGKFKFKGKYLYMPGGEVSSIPSSRERDRIVFRIKNELFNLSEFSRNQFHLISSKNDYKLKGTRDLEKFLNKNKAKYIGVDR